MSPPATLPAPLVARARRAKVGLEVGAGARFETALALAAAAPQAEWWVTDVENAQPGAARRFRLAERAEPRPRAFGDVDARILRAPPPPLRAIVLDLFAPAQEFPRADLVYAVRIPEELQTAAFALARRLRADLALRPLKDEWTDLGPARHVAWPDGWRYWPIESNRHVRIE